MRRFTIPIDGIATLLVAYSALQRIGDDGQLDTDTLDEIQCIRPKLNQLIQSIKKRPCIPCPGKQRYKGATKALKVRAGHE